MRFPQRSCILKSAPQRAHHKGRLDGELQELDARVCLLRVRAAVSDDGFELDGGRVAVLFHIRGRHDPPKRQELRLTIGELISRQFLNRKLPLPSNTQIDLTLDTTLNLNQLIGDLLEMNRARRGQPAVTP